MCRHWNEHSWRLAEAENGKADEKTGKYTLGWTHSEAESK